MKCVMQCSQMKVCDMLSPACCLMYGFTIITQLLKEVCFLSVPRAGTLTPFIHHYTHWKPTSRLYLLRACVCVFTLTTLMSFKSISSFSVPRPNTPTRTQAHTYVHTHTHQTLHKCHQRRWFTKSWMKKGSEWWAERNKMAASQSVIAACVTHSDDTRLGLMTSSLWLSACSVWSVDM